jgi:hypothetical protein
MIRYTEKVNKDDDIGRAVEFYHKLYIVCNVRPAVDNNKLLSVGVGGLRAVSQTARDRLYLVNPDGDEYGPKLHVTEAHHVAMGGVTVMHWLSDDPDNKMATPEECAELLAQAEEAERKRAEAREAARKAEQERQEKAKAEFQRLRPSWAKAVIVAKFEEDESDPMTDYFGTITTKTVLLAWSKHTRNLFPELRKAARLFDETAHLAEAPKSAEHRENWAMGAGYYLNDGHRYDTGWKIEKVTLNGFNSWVDGDYSIIKKATSDKLPAPEKTATNGKVDIQKHHHTKKGFDYYLVVLPSRVSKDVWRDFLDKAKELGGWYSRAWKGTPGGFGFMEQEQAQAFAASIQV